MHIVDDISQKESMVLTITTLCTEFFYYDCPPIKKSIYNPVTKTNDDLGKSETFQWVEEFLKHIKQKRKFALRLGKLSETMAGYHLKSEPLKQLLNGKIKPEDIT